MCQLHTLRKEKTILPGSLALIFPPRNPGTMGFMRCARCRVVNIRYGRPVLPCLKLPLCIRVWEAILWLR
jgi:hypothetical protein